MNTERKELKMEVLPAQEVSSGMVKGITALRR